VHRGSLEDLESLRAGAAGGDAVVHLAFVHGTSGFAEAARIDAQAVETIGVALEGSGRPFVVATGIGVPAARVAVVPESNAPPAARLAGPRAALRFVDKKVHTTIVCLPPVTHGPGDTHGFVPRLIAVARGKKVSAFVGDGANRWPAVHVRDAARLFHLTLEKLPAGAAVHAVADEGIPIRNIAEVIGRHLGVPVASIPADASAHFGFMGAAGVGADAAGTAGEPGDGALLSVVAFDHIRSARRPRGAPSARLTGGSSFTRAGASRFNLALEPRPYRAEQEASRHPLRSAVSRAGAVVNASSTGTARGRN
jgi:hypothetical protein